MSRKSTAEYIAAKRKRYLCAGKAKRSRILDEVQDTTGFTRKYVTNLLNGNIHYRDRKGRGKTYGPKVAATRADVWREAGCPCAPYLQEDIGMWLDEYEQYVANIEAEASLTARHDSLHPIELRHRLVKRLRRIIRRQEEYTLSKRSHDKALL